MNEYERKLFESAKKGNIEAFEQLSESYYKKVYNIILKNFGPEYDVSELAQEVFIRVFKNLGYLGDLTELAVSIYKSTGEVCLETRSRIRLIS